MCGLVGLLDPQLETSAVDLEASIRAMSSTLVHRGPDSFGTWVNAAAGVALGHRRLSILDLTQEGHQPMISRCERFVLVYNGEIYNFAELRTVLERLGHAFRGHSDTEVLLAAVVEWGLEEALRRSNGMWALALWDRKRRVLSLARDRVGKKPLYYGWVNGKLLFASELKALRALPQFDAAIDRGALALFLRHNYVPTPYSIYQDVFKLPAATALSLSLDDAASCRSHEDLARHMTAYWSARDVFEDARAEPFDGSEEEAIDELDRLLRGSINLRMVADVPVGAFLSGGVDSSSVVALMQAQCPRPVKTFTIGFREESHDEARCARAVARHLGTDHSDLYLAPGEAAAVIPELPRLYDEPFSDSSQIPTFLISRLARSQVKVSLSGDGGDELFAGYNRYFWGRRLWRVLGVVPKYARRGVAAILKSVAPGNWDAVFRRLRFLIPSGLRTQLPGDNVHKLADILAVESPDAMYHRLVSHWKEPASVALGGSEPPTALSTYGNGGALRDFTQRMMFLDLISYLPDDILVKVDRASMGVGLEARVPMLDHRIVSFAARLPLSLKIRHGRGKWILRRMLYRYVPESLIERPKMGFGVPIGSWLRGPLRDWAESLLDETRLRQEGYLDPRPIREKWTEHLSGRRNWHYYIWDVLMFQAWLRAR